MGDQTKSTSGMATAGLVLGILAVVSSWIPIINNLSFVIGLVGLVLAVVGVVGVMRGKKSGKGLAVAAVVVNVVALVVVLATQSAYSNAIDEATSGPAVSDVSAQDAGGSDGASGADSQQTSDGEAGAPASQATSDLAPGTSVTLENGLVVSVDSVQTGLTNFDGSAITGAQVTYVNNGDEGASYNTYDWKGQDADGAQEYTTYYSESTGDLGSGTLAAGGTKTGMVYFEGDTAKVLYFGSMLSDAPTASWVVE